MTASRVLVLAAVAFSTQPLVAQTQVKAPAAKQPVAAAKPATTAAPAATAAKAKAPVRAKKPAAPTKTATSAESSAPQAEAEKPAPMPKKKTAGVCDTGLEAFQKNLFPILQKNCAECHKSGPGPEHSVEDPVLSYQRVLEYVDFNNIAQSTFVVKGGNGHCQGYGYDCKTDSKKLETAITKWLNEGEESCKFESPYLSNQQKLPTQMMEDKNAFHKMTWNFGTAANSPLKNYGFQIDVQRFSDSGEGIKGAYRFRNPRLISKGRPARVKGVRILINGKYDTRANAFLPIDRVIAPAQQINPTSWSAPALSMRDLILIEANGPATDMISVAFDELDAAEAPTCMAVEAFKTNVLPVFEIGACMDCHTKGSAQGAFNLAGEISQICSESKQRITPDLVQKSPLIMLPAGRQGHPLLLTNVNELLVPVMKWFEEELKDQP
jgi:hypothetical protein